MTRRSTQSTMSLRRVSVRWVRFLVGTLIVALLVFSVGSVLYYQNKLNEVPQVQVPAVVNVSRDDADNQLRNRGLRGGVPSGLLGQHQEGRRYQR